MQAASVFKWIHPFNHNSHLRPVLGNDDRTYDTRLRMRRSKDGKFIGKKKQATLYMPHGWFHKLNVCGLVWDVGSEVTRNSWQCQKSLTVCFYWWTIYDSTSKHIKDEPLKLCGGIYI